MKNCAKCGESKPFDQFYKDRAKKDGLRNFCSLCDRQKSETRRKNFPDKVRNEVRNSKYIKKYGITAVDVENMRNAQNNKCDICYQELKSGIFTCVDHDHKTGKVRALLCRGCNLVLGNAQDSTQVLSNAILYLEKHNLLCNQESK